MARFAVGEVFGSTFRTTFSNLGPLFMTQGLIVLGWAIVTLVFTLTVMTTSMTAMFDAVSSGNPMDVFAVMGPLVLGGLVMMVAGIVVSAAGTGVGIVQVHSTLTGGGPLTLGDAWTRFRPRLGNMIGTTLLVFVILFGIILLGAVMIILVVPIFIAMGVCIWLLARWAVALPMSALDGRPVTENLKGSAQLTAGSRGAIVGLFLLLALVILVPTLVMTLPLSMMSMPDFGTGTPTAAELPSTGMQIVSWAVQTAIQLVSGFLFTTAIVLLYLRLQPPPAAPAQPIEPTMPAGSI